jgi:hypothetical protein
MLIRSLKPILSDNVEHGIKDSSNAKDLYRFEFYLWFAKYQVPTDIPVWIHHHYQNHVKLQIRKDNTYTQNQTLNDHWNDILIIINNYLKNSNRLNSKQL